MIRLRSCSGCSRHVKFTETSCPFCHCALAPAAPRVVASLPPGLSRSQRLALVAAAVASQALSGCDDTNASGGPFQSVGVPVYGAPVAGQMAPLAGSQAIAGAPTPPFDAGLDAGQSGPAPERDDDAGQGTVIPVYGAPLPSDASTSNEDASTRPVTPAPVYGAPPNP